jgi:diadenosine tetraphosphatase ApaH/serine/threonine PP2A family protein phosphatase
VLRDGVLLCHGAPDDEDEYVFNEIHASRIFDETDASIILYGHTHLPVIFSVDEGGRVGGAAVNGDAAFRLDAGYRYLINPGSVGQPRDRNPRASCAIVDSRKMTAQFFRVPYDLRKTQSAILKAGLPPMLAHRLKWGT